MKQTKIIGGGLQRYSAPTMEKIAIEIERGFAQSGVNYSPDGIVGPTEDYNNGESY